MTMTGGKEADAMSNDNPVIVITQVQLKIKNYEE